MSGRNQNLGQQLINEPLPENINSSSDGLNNNYNNNNSSQPQEMQFVSGQGICI
jgi:hypothetical protein